MPRLKPGMLFRKSIFSNWKHVLLAFVQTFDDEVAKEAEDCSHTVMMHQTLSKEKEEVSLMWVAPSAGGGCVELR